jgi:hypothetical protein
LQNPLSSRRISSLHDAMPKPALSWTNDFSHQSHRGSRAHESRCKIQWPGTIKSRLKQWTPIGSFLSKSGVNKFRHIPHPFAEMKLKLSSQSHHRRRRHRGKGISPAHRRRCNRGRDYRHQWWNHWPRKKTSTTHWRRRHLHWWGRRTKIIQPRTIPKGEQALNYIDLLG